MDQLEDGTPVYEVDGADRVVFNADTCALKFVGGDGPLVVAMHRGRATETALHLLTQPASLEDYGFELAGVTITRDSTTGHMVMSIEVKGGAKLRLLLDADQEQQFYSAPRLPPYQAGKPN